MPCCQHRVLRPVPLFGAHLRRQFGRPLPRNRQSPPFGCACTERWNTGRPRRAARTCRRGSLTRCSGSRIRSRTCRANATSRTTTRTTRLRSRRCSRHQRRKSGNRRLPFEARQRSPRLRHPRADEGARNGLVVCDPGLVSAQIPVGHRWYSAPTLAASRPRKGRRRPPQVLAAPTRTRPPAAPSARRAMWVRRR